MHRSNFHNVVCSLCSNTPVDHQNFPAKFLFIFQVTPSVSASLNFSYSAYLNSHFVFITSVTIKVIVLVNNHVNNHVKCSAFSGTSVFLMEGCTAPTNARNKLRFTNNSNDFNLL